MVTPAKPHVVAVAGDPAREDQIVAVGERDIALDAAVRRHRAVIDRLPGVERGRWRGSRPAR